MHKALEGRGTDELMEELYENLTYGGARKISKYEAELLNKLYKAYDYIRELKKDLKKDFTHETEETNKVLKTIDDAINKYCSETTVKKILLARGEKFDNENEIINALSDKELIEGQQELDEMREGDVEQINVEKMEEGRETDELMKELNGNLTDGGARKITEYEAELLDKLNKAYALIRELKRDLTHKTRKLEEAKKVLEKTYNAIDKYCTAITRDKILIHIGYQFPTDKQEEEARMAPSDKDLVECLKGKGEMRKPSIQGTQERRRRK